MGSRQRRRYPDLSVPRTRWDLPGSRVVAELDPAVPPDPALRALTALGEDLVVATLQDRLGAVRRWVHAQQAEPAPPSTDDPLIFGSGRAGGG